MENIGSNSKILVSQINGLISEINNKLSLSGGTMKGTINGTCTTANKLSVNAGNSSTPVYFSNGIPVACTSITSSNYPNLSVNFFTGTNTFSTRLPSGGSYLCIMLYSGGNASLSHRLAGGSQWAETPMTDYHCFYIRYQ